MLQEKLRFMIWRLVQYYMETRTCLFAFLTYNSKLIVICGVLILHVGYFHNSQPHIIFLSISFRLIVVSAIF